MTRDNAMWLVFGWLAGILSLMQVQVWRVWYDKRKNRHILVNPNFIPLEQRVADLDWHISELDKKTFIPKPRLEAELDPKPVVMQECPQCGKAYRRVSQHIRLAHPLKVVEDE